MCTVRCFKQGRNLLLFVAVLWLTTLATPAQPQEAPQLPVVDVYGTDLVEAADIRTEFAEELAALGTPGAGGAEASREARERMESVLMERHDFASVNLTVVGYDETAYLTIDVVEMEDAARRIPFAPRPAGQHEDPGGLLALWSEYEDRYWELASTGQLSAGACEAFHCLVAFGPNPELLPYLELFNEGVAEYQEELYEIAEGNENAANRAHALFLLAHSENGDRLLSALGRAMYDDSALVRNNAMRVMVIMSGQSPDMDFPVADLVRAMDFPMTTDRNKAAYTLVGLAESERHRDTIVQLAVPAAIQLLRLEQPLNHEPAYELLRRVSGEDFGPRDYQAWENWALRQ